MSVNKGQVIKALGIGTAVSLGVILMMLCLISGVLMMLSGIPFDALPYIVLAADAVGIFAGGYITAAIVKSRGLIFGLLCGISVFLCMLIIGLCSGYFSPNAIVLIRFGVLAVFGILGGIKGVNRKEKLHIK